MAPGFLPWGPYPPVLRPDRRSKPCRTLATKRNPTAIKVRNDFLDSSTVIRIEKIIERTPESTEDVIKNFEKPLDDLRIQNFHFMKRQDESFISPLINPVTSLTPDILKSGFQKHFFSLISREPRQFRQYKPPGKPIKFPCSDNPLFPLETGFPDRVVRLP